MVHIVTVIAGIHIRPGVSSRGQQMKKEMEGRVKKHYITIKEWGLFCIYIYLCIIHVFKGWQ